MYFLLPQIVPFINLSKAQHVFSVPLVCGSDRKEKQKNSDGERREKGPEAGDAVWKRPAAGSDEGRLIGQRGCLGATPSREPLRRSAHKMGLSPAWRSFVIEPRKAKKSGSKC